MHLYTQIGIMKLYTLLLKLIFALPTKSAPDMGLRKADSTNKRKLTNNMYRMIDVKVTVYFLKRL